MEILQRGRGSWGCRPPAPLDSRPVGGALLFFAIQLVSKLSKSTRFARMRRRNRAVMLTKRVRQLRSSVECGERACRTIEQFLRSRHRG